MRVSANPDDVEAYLTWRSLHHPELTRIWLNGEEQFKVIMADDEAGVIERTVLDAEGNIKVVGDEVATEFVHGKVYIQCPL